MKRYQNKKKIRVERRKNRYFFIYKISFLLLLCLVFYFVFLLCFFCCCLKYCLCALYSRVTLSHTLFLINLSQQHTFEIRLTHNLVSLKLLNWLTVVVNEKNVVTTRFPFSFYVFLSFRLSLCVPYTQILSFICSLTHTHAVPFRSFLLILCCFGVCTCM